MSAPKMYVAADPLATELRVSVVEHLQKAHPELEVVDLGTHDKYYEAAYKAGGMVQKSREAGGQDRAVLICGTGMGMSIIANKHPDVYAAVVESKEAAANAAAINNANVLTLGAKVFNAEEAAAAIDKWLSTPFTSLFPDFKEFLQASMTEIPAMLKGQQQQQAGSSDSPSVPEVALIKDGQLPTWEPIGGMGHDSCVWCHLRGSLAGGEEASGVGVRALARFPAGCMEPPHHHTHGQELLVLSGEKTFTNYTTGKAVRLGPWGFTYTPGGQVHSAEYHKDTVFYIGFDGPMDMHWADPSAPGIKWLSDEAQAAAEATPWQPSDGMLSMLEGMAKGVVEVPMPGNGN